MLILPVGIEKVAPRFNELLGTVCLEHLSAS
jgi:hypothetical protein